ncbi:MAG: hypothetical protein KatS3mg129_1791 [Leptospiraceae bacterium]|nr:MAG: hypothetical protein KatS3mg129_1791 [Leptospiraceae bacterium]
MIEDIARLFIFLGIIFLFLGLFFILISSDHIPFLKYLGKLPGDIYIEKENFKFYFPITTSILISILLSLIFYIINRLR